jgi:large subunit ribosomal protein L22
MKNANQNQKEVVARASFVRSSPRKLRLMADMVRKFEPQQAVEYLRVVNKRAAKPLMLVFEQGIANAKNNFQMSPGNLQIKTLQIEEGPRGPKRLDKSHSARFDRGVKRKKISHILLRLVEKEGVSNGAKS